MVRNLPATKCARKVHKLFQQVLRDPFKEANVLHSVDIVNEGGPADASKAAVLVFGHHIAILATIWIDTIEYKDTELDIGRPDDYIEAQSDPPDHIEVVGGILAIAQHALALSEMLGTKLPHFVYLICFARVAPEGWSYERDKQAKSEACFS